VDSLDEAMKKQGITSFGKARIVIERTNNRLNLYSDSVLVKSYKAVFGRNVLPKIKKGDFGTPRGIYKVCKIKDDNRYYKFILINYPSIRDAAEALKNGYLNESEYLKIYNESTDGNCSFPWSNLGGMVGIHGIGTYNEIFKNLPFIFNWTNGSAAVSNESMDELIKVVKSGTEVEIRFK